MVSMNGTTSDRGNGAFDEAALIQGIGMDVDLLTVRQMFQE